MADRTIVLAQNKRHAVRGLTVVNPQEFAAVQEQDDDLTYIIDMSSYLDGATISSVTRTPTGVTVSNTSNTTTRLTQRLKGFGHVDFKVTTSSGDVEEFRLVIQQRASSSLQQIAQVPDPMPVAYTEVRDPTNADDTLDGYFVGSVWINTLTQNVFDCISNSQGAAIWRHRPRILASSASAVTAPADTAVNTLATYTLPAGTMGVNGEIEVEAIFTVNNNANTKTPRLHFGGSNIAGQALASSAASVERWVLKNRTTSSQIGRPAAAGTGGYGATTASVSTLAIDTTAAVTILITGQKATAGDTMTLEGYTITLTRPDIT